VSSTVIEFDGPQIIENVGANHAQTQLQCLSIGYICWMCWILLNTQVVGFSEAARSSLAPMSLMNQDIISQRQYRLPLIRFGSRPQLGSIIARVLARFGVTYNTDMDNFHSSWMSSSVKSLTFWFRDQRSSLLLLQVLQLLYGPLWGLAA
jgi:hypothetical protein